MVGGFGRQPWAFVDRTGKQPVNRRRVQKQIVYPHAEIGGEGVAGIVPEGISRVFRMQGAKRVVKTAVAQGVQLAPHFREKKGVVGKGFRIIKRRFRSK